MSIPVIQQVKIQAQVLVPLVKALQRELGEQRANVLVRRALGDVYRRFGEEFWRTKNEKDLGKNMASAFAAFARDDALEYQLRAQSPDAFAIDVTRCRYAEFYKEAQRLSPKRAPAPLTAAEERGLRPKDRFKECPDCPEMVVVPAGSFTIGSPPNEEGRGDDEVQRQYTFARPFAVGRFEVTRAEWAACYADKRCGGLFRDKGRNPVLLVSWENATAYVTWLSGKTGKEYRLLTGAEWEYAARAGTTTRYAFGNMITERQAKFSADGSWQVPFVLRPFTWDDVEVGSFPPNAWGLHDMHGDVWEWCSDASSKVVSGNAFETRMLRGGSWNSPLEDLRSARRRWHFPLVEERDVGLRVARTL